MKPFTLCVGCRRPSSPALCDACDAVVQRAIAERGAALCAADAAETSTCSL